MKYLLFILILASFTNAYSQEVSLGLFRLNNNVQDINGKAEVDPFEPSLALGYEVELSESHSFSPLIGFIKRKVKSNDSYAEYSKSTIFILYDMAWAPFDVKEFKFRYGIGNFITSISGDGGNVTVPNGSNGTSVEEKPGKTSRSYTGSINFGAEYRFLDKFNARLEAFFYSFTTKEQRSEAIWLSMGYYF